MQLVLLVLHLNITLESKIPSYIMMREIPVSYKSNDCILCQLFREGEIDSDDVLACRKDVRRITYSKEQADHSVVLVTEMVDNDAFIELIKDKTVHIIF